MTKKNKECEKLLWIAEDGSRIIQDHSSDDVMDSVIYYYKMDKPNIKYEYSRLFLDNGAYSSARKGIDLDREKVIEVQESIFPDLTIPLDYPLSRNDTSNSFKEKWSKTKENVLLWQNCTKLQGRLAPVLHSWGLDSLLENVRWLQKYCDSEIICLGSIVNSSIISKNFYFGDRTSSREFISILFKAICIVREQSDFKVHITGYGSSPLSLHLAYWLGADSVDSAGHRRRAAYGNIILPGTSDRYVGGKNGQFIKRKPNIKEMEMISKCQCPICRENSTHLWKNWEARAIHNKFVIKAERERAESWLAESRDFYEKQLDNLYAQTGIYNLWKHAKILVKYPSIRNYIREML